jgi:hypothetical protein
MTPYGVYYYATIPSGLKNAGTKVHASLPDEQICRKI